jgi:hypothetical protein
MAGTFYYVSGWCGKLSDREPSQMVFCSAVKENGGTPLPRWPGQIIIESTILNLGEGLPKRLFADHASTHDLNVIARMTDRV